MQLQFINDKHILIKSTLHISTNPEIEKLFKKKLNKQNGMKPRNDGTANGVKINRPSTLKKKNISKVCYTHFSHDIFEKTLISTLFHYK